MAEKSPRVTLSISCPATRLRYTNRTQFLGSLFLQYYPPGWYRYRLTIYKDGKRDGGWEREFYVNPLCLEGQRQGTTFSFEVGFQKPGTHRVWVEVELFNSRGELVWKGRSNIVEVVYSPPGLVKRVEMQIIKVPEEVPLGVEPKRCPKIFGKVVMEGYPVGTYRLEIEAIDETEGRPLSLSAKNVAKLTETKRIAEFPFIVNLYGFTKEGEHRITIHARIFDEKGNEVWRGSKQVTINVVKIEQKQEEKKEEEKEKERKPAYSPRSYTVRVGAMPGGLEISIVYHRGGGYGQRGRATEQLVL